MSGRDSLTVITELKKLSNLGGSSLMVNCKNMLREVMSSRITHISRETNGSADWMANWGRIVEEMYEWIDSSQIISLLYCKEMHQGVFSG